MSLDVGGVSATIPNVPLTLFHLRKARHFRKNLILAESYNREMVGDYALISGPVACAIVSLRIERHRQHASLDAGQMRMTTRTATFACIWCSPVDVGE